jgi:hypothetical protein
MYHAQKIYCRIQQKLIPVAVVRMRAIPTERPPLVSEVSAKLCR